MLKEDTKDLRIAVLHYEIFKTTKDKSYRDKALPLYRNPDIGYKGRVLKPQA